MDRLLPIASFLLLLGSGACDVAAKTTDSTEVAGSVGSGGAAEASGLPAGAGSSPRAVRVCTATGADWCAELNGGVALEYSTSIVRDPEGNLVILGRTEGSIAGPAHGEFDVFVAKYAPDGQVLWLKQYGTSRSEIPGPLTVDASGNIFFGYRGDLPGSEVLTAGFIQKLSADGDPIWNRQLGTDVPTGITAAADGSIFFAEANFSAPLLGKFSPSGALLWTRGNFGGDVALTSTGDLVLSSLVETKAGVALLSSDGDLLWRDDSFSANAFAVDANDNVFAFGSETIRRYSTSGEVVWEAPLDDRISFASDIAVDANGHVFVIGMANGLSDPFYQVYISEYSQEGELIGGRALAVAGSFEGFFLVAVDDGELFITGPLMSGVFTAHMTF